MELSVKSLVNAILDSTDLFNARDVIHQKYANLFDINARKIKEIKQCICANRA